MYRIQLELSGEDLDNLVVHLTHALRAYMTPGFFEPQIVDSLRDSVQRTIEEINAAGDLVEKVE